MSDSNTLGARLAYRPTELKFGTSGRRGLVTDLTQLEIFIDVKAELEFLQSLPLADGGVTRGDEFYFAYDLRPSSTAFSAEADGRGEIAQAVVAALLDAGMRPLNMGAIPTPALAAYAFARHKGSIMVTGSHIPFDRNGYKLNTSCGELLKNHEAPIGERVRCVREKLYSQAFADSPFDERGMLKGGHEDLPPARDDARVAYLRRYTDFFAGCSLAGRRILVYQHSAVGRDLLVEMLRGFGAEVLPAGRSETFVPIDTENMGPAQLGPIQAMADEAAARGTVDAVVSADGDTDRPLLLGVEPATGKVRFFGGDMLGMITAGYLGADAVVVPISCNDAIDRSPLAAALEPKTRIGSPYVIAGIERAKQEGRRAVCGWEANGGFLTGSDIERSGRMLPSLATRDAFLPLLCCLFSSVDRGLPLVDLFATLPKRYSKAALIPQFPNATSKRIVASYSPVDSRVRDVSFSGANVRACGESGSPIELSDKEADRLRAIHRRLASHFTSAAGFAPIARLNYTDGVRIGFANGDVAHFRPSGNADEFRIYAVADSPERAEVIADLATRGDGMLRRMAEE
jgi:phosphomannomutase